MKLSHSEACLKLLRGSTLVDLTHTLEDGIPYWDGGCGFECVVNLAYETCPTETKFQTHRLEMDAGIGTHIDAPVHCFPTGAAVDELPLQQLLVPCVVIDVSDRAHAHYLVSVEDLEKFEDAHGQINSGELVFIRTGWERFWQQPEKYHNQLQFPSVSEEAAVWLLKRDIVGLGIDTLSPDTAGSSYPVHRTILGAGKYIVENCANLHKLPPRGSLAFALPIKIKAATEAPIRLFAWILD